MNRNQSIPGVARFGENMAVISSNVRMPQADLTNAKELFGDPFGYGEVEEGDPYGYGDVADIMSPYLAISGDVETGGPSLPAPIRRAISAVRAHPGRAAAIAAGVGLTVYELQNLIRNHHLRVPFIGKDARVNQWLAGQRNKQTLANQTMIKHHIGVTSRTDALPFFAVKGAKLNSAPIIPTSSFPADMMKNFLDRQNSDTPFLQDTYVGTFAGVTWTISATGIVAQRFVPCIWVQIGTNMLNASPGTVINIAITIPTLAGPLVIASEPFLMTYEQGYDVRLQIIPYALVQSNPQPVLGFYNNANPITATVTGLPAQSAVNLVIPGTGHPWTIGVRNSFLKGVPTAQPHHV